MEDSGSGPNESFETFDPFDNDETILWAEPSHRIRYTKGEYTAALRGARMPDRYCDCSSGRETVRAPRDPAPPGFRC